MEEIIKQIEHTIEYFKNAQTDFQRGRVFEAKILHALLRMSFTCWHSVEDRPLFTKNERGNWICTEDGDGEFIAALPYNDSKRPNENLWWIRHCVVEDETGLCIVGDDYNQPAGWNLEDITHWMPMPSPPDCR
jgi:hypothetical protein